jgi:hypothetical protein
MPRIPASHMLRSTMKTVSAPASSSFRGSLPHPTPPLCTLRVRRHRRLTQHSLPGSLLSRNSRSGEPIVPRIAWPACTENINRKEFTVEERVAIGQATEKLVGFAFHPAPTLAPAKGIAAASNSRRATWTADHLPPQAAGRPRSSKPAAMARSGSQPLASSS